MFSVLSRTPNGIGKIDKNDNWGGMMKVKHIFVFVGMFFVGCCQFVSGSETISDADLQQAVIKMQKIQILDRPCVLVGMGMTQLMNDDYYIGAFYMDEAADRFVAEDLIEIQVPKRMEFKFVSDRRVPASSFKRQFVQGIKINNKKEDINGQRGNIKKLLKLFKGSYRKGDTLTLDYHPTFGTRMSKNGKIVGEVAGGGGLFPLLVKVWVGERPPSSIFKNSLLGKSSTADVIALQKRFVSL